MGTTKDPIGEYLDLDEADSDPPSVGQIGYRSGAFRMKDAIGVFDPRAGATGALPIPDEAGQILYACDATAFVKVRPLVSIGGWLLNDGGLLLVPG